MLGSVETLDWSFLKHIQHHIPVCKCLLCGSALGHQDEECGLQIESFDQFVVLLKNQVSQMVYKHAISTIVPARAVTIPTEETEDQQEATPAAAE